MKKKSKDQNLEMPSSKKKKKRRERTAKKQGEQVKPISQSRRKVVAFNVQSTNYTMQRHLDTRTHGSQELISPKEEEEKEEVGLLSCIDFLHIFRHLMETLSWPEQRHSDKVLKRLWTYIQEKNLQDTKNRQNILCDESLQAHFRVNTINMLQMIKALSKHMWPLNQEDAQADSAKVERKSKQA